MISRRSHQAAKTPAYAGAPTERLKYAPSMPHWRPRMNARPQITSAEPRIRMPACRSASPKKWSTRPLKTEATMRAENLAMSPKDASQSRGTLSQLEPITSPSTRCVRGSLSSFDHRDLGMGGEQRLGEDVVEGEDAEELDHHALVDRPPNAFGTSRGRHSLVTGDDRDDRAEQRRLHYRSPEVRGTRVVEEGREERAEWRVEGERGEDAAEDSEDERVDVEQAGDGHQRQEPRHHEVLDRVDAHHLKRVKLLADLAGAEVRCDRGAAHAGGDDGGHRRCELADRGEHEEAAEPVDGAEQDQEVARLEPGRAVAERDRRDREREPAEAQHEQELLHELGAVRVRRTQGGHHGLPCEDHHVANLLQQVLGRQEDPIGCGSYHSLYSSPSKAYGMHWRRARGNRRWRVSGAVPWVSGYVPGAVRAWRMYVVPVCLLAFAGCGQGERQDENEASGNFPVEIVKASFPETQKLAQSSDLVVTLRNAGRETIPNIGLTVDGLDRRTTSADVAD